jgi:hypothetical protein
MKGFTRTGSNHIGSFKLFIHGEVDTSDDVYYKLKRRDTGIVTVCAIQWFDEIDYDQSTFIINSNGEQHVFADEDEAIKFLNEKFNSLEIDPIYLYCNLDSDNVRD